MFFFLLFLLCLSFLSSSIQASCLPEGFTLLSEIDSSILQDIRYYSAHNFMGRRVEGYNSPVCILSRPAAIALSAVQQDALKAGYSLKVYDCYRPQRAVNDFVNWSQNPYDFLTKREFYPTLEKMALFPDYIATKSGHSRGSTMDLTLVRVSDPMPQQAVYLPGQPLVSCFASLDRRYQDNSIDMGTGFDCLSPWAHTDSDKVGEEQRQNRKLLVDLMAAHNFTNYEDEWWHYTLAGEPYPSTYFDFPIQVDCGC